MFNAHLIDLDTIICITEHEFVLDWSTVSRMIGYGNIVGRLNTNSVHPGWTCDFELEGKCQSDFRPLLPWQSFPVPLNVTYAIRFLQPTVSYNVALFISEM